MFTHNQLETAGALLERLRKDKRILATAESCTGGLLAALFTQIPGSSDVMDRGFITYSNDAKIEMLGVNLDLISQQGAVSSPVAEAMALGALTHSPADLTLSITGIAGPGGGSKEKPVGLVYLAFACTGHEPVVEEHRFGDAGRAEIRSKTLDAALSLMTRALNENSCHETVG